MRCDPKVVRRPTRINEAARHIVGPMADLVVPVVYSITCQYVKPLGW